MESSLLTMVIWTLGKEIHCFNTSKPDNILVIMSHTAQTFEPYQEQILSGRTPGFNPFSAKLIFGRGRGGGGELGNFIATLVLILFFFFFCQLIELFHKTMKKK